MVTPTLQTSSATVRRTKLRPLLLLRVAAPAPAIWTKAILLTAPLYHDQLRFLELDGRYSDSGTIPAYLLLPLIPFRSLRLKSRPTPCRESYSGKPSHMPGTSLLPSSFQSLSPQTYGVGQISCTHWPLPRAASLIAPY